jgi:translation initiation factor 2 subunit 1
MRKKGLPERGELVVCQIKKIYPNSVLAELIEYRKTGMIHVSEVARRWVKDIREFLRERQYVVCKVMSVDEDSIFLSVKRVHRMEANRKLNKFKMERKAEKMLEIAAKSLKKSLDQAYEEIGYELQDIFGSLSKAFETALKNPDLFKEKNVPKKWADAIIEIAKKSYTEKIYEVKVRITATCFKENGVDVIKKAMSSENKEGIEIKYISAPHYMMKGTGKNYKELHQKMVETAEKIVKEIKRNGGEASFEILK